MGIVPTFSEFVTSTHKMSVKNISLCIIYSATMLFTPKFPLQRCQSDQHNKIKSKFKVSCNTVVQGIQQKQKFND